MGQASEAYGFWPIDKHLHSHRNLWECRCISHINVLVEICGSVGAWFDSLSNSDFLIARRLMGHLSDTILRRVPKFSSQKRHTESSHAYIARDLMWGTQKKSCCGICHTETRTEMFFTRRLVTLSHLTHILRGTSCGAARKSYFVKSVILGRVPKIFPPGVLGVSGCVWEPALLDSESAGAQHY